jgi:hypothetical protein
VTEKFPSRMHRQEGQGEWAEPKFPRVFQALQLQRPRPRMWWDVAGLRTNAAAGLHGEIVPRPVGKPGRRFTSLSTSATRPTKSLSRIAKARTRSARAAYLIESGGLVLSELEIDRVRVVVCLTTVLRSGNREHGIL